MILTKLIFFLSLLPKQCNSFTNTITKPSVSFLTLKQQTTSSETKSKPVLLERKLYRLNPSVSSFLNKNISGSYFQIEEQIEYENNNDELLAGSKRIILRNKPKEEDDRTLPEPRRVVHVGEELFRFSLEESNLNDDDVDIEEQGIGGIAWESSIAMSLFFASRPELLSNNILELGSGVGLGGLLSAISSYQSILQSNTQSKMKSLTLSDNNESILKHCAHNIQQISSALKESSINLGINVNVQQLDWYSDIPSGIKHTFQTVIAADCAYLYPDIKPLSNTIAYLLAPQDEAGKSFVFGPYQRNALRDLQTTLEDKYRMDVNLALLEMEVFDLEPLIFSKDDNDTLPEYLKPVKSKKMQEFLLIEAEHDRMFRTDIIDGDEYFFVAEDEDRNLRLDLEPEFER